MGPLRCVEAVAEPAKIPSAVHYPVRSRPCVHLLSDSVPDVVLFGRAALSRLTFQPRVTAAPCPVIASRTGDLLTISFDRRGPVKYCHHTPGTPGHVFRYRLTAVDANTVAGTLTEATL